MSRMSAEEYRLAMDALVRETRMPADSVARIERQLLDAFASGENVNIVPSTRTKSVVARYWMPAAAAIVLSAGAAFVWWTDRPLVNSQLAVPPRVADKAPPPPTVGPTTTASSSVEATATQSPVVSRKPSRTSNVVTPSGFVDLPWTTGLPAFESGEIVRMDIPVASLPTYGIDISSGAGKGPVEADVLIGQDGFARAIRLVTTSSRSMQ
jgi:hypothetical protein